MVFNNRSTSTIHMKKQQYQNQHYSSLATGTTSSSTAMNKPMSQPRPSAAALVHDTSSFAMPSSASSPALSSHSSASSSSSSSSAVSNANENNKKINLIALKNQDPFAANIVDSAMRVAVYRFQAKKNEWKKLDVEGSLFLFERMCEPLHSVAVMNTLALNLFLQPITADLEFQDRRPFLLYRSATDVFGIWFMDDADCARIKDRIVDLTRAAQQRRAQRATQKNKPTTTATETTTAEQVESCHFTAVSTPNPLSKLFATGGAQGEEALKQQGANVDILDMLVKAQRNFDHTKLQSSGPSGHSTPGGNAETTKLNPVVKMLLEGTQKQQQPASKSSYDALSEELKRQLNIKSASSGLKRPMTVQDFEDSLLNSQSTPTSRSLPVLCQQQQQTSTHFYLTSASDVTSSSGSSASLMLKKKLSTTTSRSSINSLADVSSSTSSSSSDSSSSDSESESNALPLLLTPAAFESSSSSSSSSSTCSSSAASTTSSFAANNNKRFFAKFNAANQANKTATNSTSSLNELCNQQQHQQQTMMNPLEMFMFSRLDMAKRTIAQPNNDLSSNSSSGSNDSSSSVSLLTKAQLQQALVHLLNVITRLTLHHHSISIKSKEKHHFIFLLLFSHFVSPSLLPPKTDDQFVSSLHQAYMKSNMLTQIDATHTTTTTVTAPTAATAVNKEQAHTYAQIATAASK